MQLTRMLVLAVHHIAIPCLLMGLLMTACTSIVPIYPDTLDATPDAPTPDHTSTEACPVTEPDWVKPPEDSAVQDPPEFGYYYTNQDGSMLASAWWTGTEENYLRAGEEGIKIGWFRPEGAELSITGRRLDEQAPPLDTHVPCCYPTRFQSSGLIFPTEGCWEISAKAADSELSFVVQVAP